MMKSDRYLSLMAGAAALRRIRDIDGMNAIAMGGRPTKQICFVDRSGRNFVFFDDAIRQLNKMAEEEKEK